MQRTRCGLSQPSDSLLNHAKVAAGRSVLTVNNYSYEDSSAPRHKFLAADRENCFPYVLRSLCLGCVNTEVFSVNIRLFLKQPPFL